MKRHLFCAAAFFLGCTSNNTLTNLCVPGQACLGLGDCAGQQSCNADGTNGPCQCPSNQQDAGNGKDAGSNWTPAQMTGLVLWLESGAATAGANGVSTWTDASGRHNDFVAGSSAPALDTGGLGGKDLVRFTAASSQSLSTSSTRSDFAWGTSDFLIEMVVANIGPCSGSICPNPAWSSSGGSTVELLFNLFASDAGFVVAAGGFHDGGYGASGEFSPASAHVVGMQRSGGVGSVRVDGRITSFGLVGVNYSAPEMGHLGYDPGDTGGTPLWLDGEIAEVVAASSPAASDVVQLEAYLRAKFGL